MAETAPFTIGADAIFPDGACSGKLSGVVVDPVDRAVTHLLGDSMALAACPARPCRRHERRGPARLQPCGVRRARTRRDHGVPAPQPSGQRLPPGPGAHLALLRPHDVTVGVPSDGVGDETRVWSSAASRPARSSPVRLFPSSRRRPIRNADAQVAHVHLISPWSQPGASPERLAMPILPAGRRPNVP